MTTERDLDEILAEIGRAHRAIGAPKSLEPVLLSAVDRRKRAIRRRRVRFVTTLAAAAVLLAAVAVGGVAWQIRRSQQAQMQRAQMQRAPMHQAGPGPGPAPRLGSGAGAASAQAPPYQDFQSKSAPVHRAGSVRAGLRDTAAKRAAGNSLDEFVALPVSEGLPTATELSVVRMRLRGSDLQQYGLEAPADAAARTLLAEFVVGEDGLPRAIRIVR